MLPQDHRKAQGFPRSRELSPGQVQVPPARSHINGEWEGTDSERKGVGAAWSQWLGNTRLPRSPVKPPDTQAPVHLWHLCPQRGRALHLGTCVMPCSKVLHVLTHWILTTTHLRQITWSPFHRCRDREAKGLQAGRQISIRAGI